MNTKTLMRSGTVVLKNNSKFRILSVFTSKILSSTYLVVLLATVLFLHIFGLSNQFVNTISNEQYTEVIGQLKTQKGVDSFFDSPRKGRYSLLFFHISPSILSYNAALDYLRDEPIINGLSVTELDVQTDHNWHLAYNYRLSTYPTWILLSRDGLFLHKWVGKINMTEVQQVIEQKELWN
jgi:hypothetical protein